MLHWADLLVIVSYFLVIILVGIWSSVKSKRDSVQGYFLANKNTHWIPVGASLFASNIGSAHFVGLAGSAASFGVGVAGFELGAIHMLVMLGWVFVPIYTAANVYTMPEYLRKRFGGQRIRIYLSVLCLMLYIFTKISADLFAGAIFMRASLNWDLYLSVGALLVLAALFTIAGGLTAVMWTDLVQTILMVIGALALAVISMREVGGYDKLFESFRLSETSFNATSQNGTCSRPPENFAHLLRSVSDPDVPWTGMIIGLAINCFWYWCSDQVIVQRALSARSLTHAKAGCVLAGYLKLTPLFLMVLPGMAARVLFTGARGMMLSVMLAALMSSLTSIFNSASTLFTMDIWTRLRREASDIELLVVGKMFVLVLVLLSIAWIPIIQRTQGGQLFHYINSVASCLSPPVGTVYVLAIFWERINEKGAFAGLMLGLTMGLVRFALDLIWSVPSCGQPDLRPSVLADFHYLHFSILLFIVTFITTVLVSLLTEPIDRKFLVRLTVWTLDSADVRHDLGKDSPDIQMVELNGYVSQVHPTNGKEVTPAENATKISISCRLWYFLCGISKELRESTRGPSITLQEQALESVKSLEEKPFWKNVVNVNAVLLLMASAFVWGMYA